MLLSAVVASMRPRGDIVLTCTFILFIVAHVQAQAPELCVATERYETIASTGGANGVVFRILLSQAPLMLESVHVVYTGAPDSIAVWMTRDTWLFDEEFAFDDKWEWLGTVDVEAVMPGLEGRLEIELGQLVTAGSWRGVYIHATSQNGEVEIYYAEEFTSVAEYHVTLGAGYYSDEWFTLDLLPSSANRSAILRGSMCFSSLNIAEGLPVFINESTPCPLTDECSAEHRAQVTDGIFYDGALGERNGVWWPSGAEEEPEFYIELPSFQDIYAMLIQASCANTIHLKYRDLLGEKQHLVSSPGNIQLWCAQVGLVTRPYISLQVPVYTNRVYFSCETFAAGMNSFSCSISEIQLYSLPFPTGACRDISDPNWSADEFCCGSEAPCSLGNGGCTLDEDCEGALVCGFDNCAALTPKMWPTDRVFNCCVAATDTDGELTTDPGFTLGCLLVLEGTEYRDSVSLSDNFEISLNWDAGEFLYNGGYNEIFRVARNVSTSSPQQSDSDSEVEVGVALYVGSDKDGTRFHLVVAQRGGSPCRYTQNTDFIRSEGVGSVSTQPNIADCCEECDTIQECVSATYDSTLRECRPLRIAPADNTYPRLDRIIITPGNETCSFEDDKDLVLVARSYTYPEGLEVNDEAECCEACLGDDMCVAAIYNKATPFCWLLASAPLNNLVHDSTKTTIFRAPGAAGNTCSAPSTNVSDVRIRVLGNQVSLYTDGALACRFTQYDTSLFPMVNATLETSRTFTPADGIFCDFELRNMPRSTPTPTFPPSPAPTLIPSVAPTPLPSRAPTLEPSLTPTVAPSPTATANPTPIPSSDPLPTPSLMLVTPMASPSPTASPSSRGDDPQAVLAGSANTSNAIFWSAVAIATFMTAVTLCLLLRNRCKTCAATVGKGKYLDDDATALAGPNTDVDVSLELQSGVVAARRMRVGSRSGSISDGSYVTDTDSDTDSTSSVTNSDGSDEELSPPGYEESSVPSRGSDGNHRNARRRGDRDAQELAEVDQADGPNNGHRKRPHSCSTPTKAVSGVHFKQRTKARRRIDGDVDGVRRADLQVDVPDKDDVKLEEQNDVDSGSDMYSNESVASSSSTFLDMAAAIDDEDDDEMPLVFVDVDHVDEVQPRVPAGSSDSDTDGSVSTLFGAAGSSSTGGDSSSSDDDEGQIARAEVVRPLMAPDPKRRKRRGGRVSKANAEKQKKYYDCEVCQAKIRGISNFLVHMREQHGKVQGHVCPHCSNVFTRKYNLQVHIKTHLDKRSNVCPTCGAGFTQKSNLKRHIELIHEKQLKCPLCEHRFKKPEDAMAHYRKVHPDAKPIEGWRRRAARKTAKDELRCVCKMKFSRKHFEAHQAKCRVAKDVRRKQAVVEVIVDDAPKAVNPRSVANHGGPAPAAVNPKPGRQARVSQGGAAPYDVSSPLVEDTPKALNHELVANFGAVIDSSANKSVKNSEQIRFLKSKGDTSRAANCGSRAVNLEVAHVAEAGTAANLEHGSPSGVALPLVGGEPSSSVTGGVLSGQMAPPLRHDSLAHTLTHPAMSLLSTSGVHQTPRQLPERSSPSVRSLSNAELLADGGRQGTRQGTVSLPSGLPMQASAVTATSALSTLEAVNPLDRTYGATAADANGTFYSTAAAAADSSGTFDSATTPNILDTARAAATATVVPLATRPDSPFDTGGNFAHPMTSSLLSMSSSTSNIGSSFPPSRDCVDANIASLELPRSSMALTNYAPHVSSAVNVAADPTTPTPAPFPSALVPPSAPMATSPSNTYISLQHTTAGASIRIPVGNAAPPDPPTAPTVASLMQHLIYAPSDEYALTFIKNLREQHGIKLSSLMSRRRSNVNTPTATTKATATATSTAVFSNVPPSHAGTSSSSQRQPFHSANEFPPSHASVSQHQLPHASASELPLSHASVSHHQLPHASASELPFSHINSSGLASHASLTDSHIFVSPSAEVDTLSPPRASSSMIAQPFVVPTSVSLPALTATTSQPSVGNMSLPMSTRTHRRDSTLSNSLGRQYSGNSVSGLAIQRQHSGSPSIADPTLLDLVQDPVGMEFRRRVDSFTKLSRAESLSHMSDGGAGAAMPHEGTRSRSASLSHKSDNISDPMSMGAYETSSALLTSVSQEPLLFREGSLPGNHDHLPSGNDTI